MTTRRTLLLALLAFALGACGAKTSPVEAAKLLSWNAATDGDPKTYTIDGYALTFSSREVQGGRIPALHVRAPSGEEGDVTGAGGFPEIAAEFAIGKLDGLSSTEQIIFSTFTGGAHCCTAVQVLQLVGKQWKTIDLGQWDGDGLGKYPVDMDNNGRADFVFSDDRFAYAFTDYADSLMPPRVFEIRNGVAVEGTASGRYRGLFEVDMRQAERACVLHNNGACAAFVADAARLGLFDQAWTTMLENYDVKREWDYPKVCTVEVASGECPKEQQQSFTSFPEALAWFLNDTGYRKPLAGQPMVPPPPADP